MEYGKSNFGWGAALRQGVLLAMAPRRAYARPMASMLRVILAAGAVTTSAALPDLGPSLPPLVPVSTTYASIDPAGSAAWMVQFLGAVPIQQNITSEGHNDCGAVAWVLLPGSNYEFHFVFDPNKPSGDALDIAG
jgi:hypothetical protein